MVPDRITRRDALRLSSVALLGLAGCTTRGPEETPTDSTPSSTSSPTTPATSTSTTAASPMETDTESPTTTATMGSLSASVSTGYVKFYSWYTVRGNLVADPEQPTSFAELSPENRVMVASAITRAGYLTYESPQLSTSGNDPIVAYDGASFDVTVSVADIFREPEHGPEYDPDWTDPVSLDARVLDDTLVLTLTNELDVPLDVHHFGRPYFGVLTAVSETPTLLPHDRYEENEFIRTEPIVHTVGLLELERRAEPLDPGDSLQDGYDLPESLPAESTVWLSLPIRDDDVEMFGDYNPSFTARISLTRGSE